MSSALVNAGLGLDLSPALAVSSYAPDVLAAKKPLYDINTTGNQSLHHASLGFVPMHKLGSQSSQQTLGSYWSPESDAGDSFDDVEDVSSSPESFFVETPSEAARKVQATRKQLAPHACLHLLSPKLQVMCQSGMKLEEAISEAVDFAWLVPMLDLHDKEARPAELDEHAPAPAMHQRPSLMSLASDFTDTSVSTCPSLGDGQSFDLQSLRSKEDNTSPEDGKSMRSGAVLERRHPLSARSTRDGLATVIQLRGASRSRKDFAKEPIDTVNIVLPTAITRRDTTTSMRSLVASICFGSPDIQQRSESANYAECHSRHAPSSVFSPNPSYVSRATGYYESHETLVQLWEAAEAARERRGLPRHVPRKLKKSPIAKGQTKSSLKTSHETERANKRVTFDSCFEPRNASEEAAMAATIESVFDAGRSADKEKDLPRIPLVSRDISEPLWTFLG